MMLLHHPGTGDVDAYLAMEKAVEEGKIRSIGLSNWYVEELEEFLPQVNITPALVQNEIHPSFEWRNGALNTLDAMNHFFPGCLQPFKCFRKARGAA